MVSFIGNFPVIVTATSFFYECRKLNSFAGSLPQVANGSSLFACTPLRTFDSELPALSNGKSMFNECQLDKESALRVLVSIPAYESGSHPLTIGIHVDNKTDEEVLAAIEGATVKGWTVTVQWNGKATVSTFSLRPTPPPPVYAKREQVADGDYEDAAGQRWMVDWGHEVVSPQGEPEELGYELFESVEAALEQWGMVAYVAPEVE